MLAKDDDRAMSLGLRSTANRSPLSQKPLVQESHR
jgi:hypothetical protein